MRHPRKLQGDEKRVEVGRRGKVKQQGNGESSPWRSREPLIQLQLLMLFTLSQFELYVLKGLLSIVQLAPNALSSYVSVKRGIMTL